MIPLSLLFENNRRWAAEMAQATPSLFSRLARQQSPQFLWIGCSDSRIPPNEITGLLPGEMFVHRNVGNLVIHTDMNLLSVLQYAVENLKVRHIIVCGHYGCGGIGAVLDGKSHGLVDNWLRTVFTLYRRHSRDLDLLPDHNKKVDRLCELNVTDQVLNVGNTTIVRQAWHREQPLSVHGWIYSLKDGLITDLQTTLSSSEDLRNAENRCLL